MIKLVLLYVMALLYVAAGIYHFVNPKMYQRIMPTYLPWHLPLVYISGVCEIVFALLLLPESTRPIGAWLVIALLIAVFPANIQMAVTYWQKQKPALWIAIARLPLQLVLIYWAWIYTKK
ncbi:MAG: MauE/DoxX family redox-associated membrane protein [Bacteroidia bacterium]